MWGGGATQLKVFLASGVHTVRTREESGEDYRVDRTYEIGGQRDRKVAPSCALPPLVAFLRGGDEGEVIRGTPSFAMFGFIRVHLSTLGVLGSALALWPNSLSIRANSLHSWVNHMLVGATQLMCSGMGINQCECKLSSNNMQRGATGSNNGSADATAFNNMQRDPRSKQYGCNIRVCAQYFHTSHGHFYSRCRPHIPVRCSSHNQQHPKSTNTNTIQEHATNGNIALQHPPTCENVPRSAPTRQQSIVSTNGEQCPNSDQHHPHPTVSISVQHNQRTRNNTSDQYHPTPSKRIFPHHSEATLCLCCIPLPVHAVCSSSEISHSTHRCWMPG